MVNPVEQTFDDTQVKENAKKQISQVETILIWTIIVGGILILLSILIFAVHRDYWLWENSFNEQVFGSFGDFVGGFFGTIVAFITLFLLIRTLQNQIEVNGSVVITNNNVVETNKKLIDASLQQIRQTDVQLFDSKFNAYMKSYQEATSLYRDRNLVGRKCLDALVEEFRGSGFKSELKYIPRSEAALKSFEEFYSNNRQAMSVHLRTLYLMVKMIGDEVTITDDIRVHYAKLVRGQLSESEMFLMRYNCYSTYGYNMQVFVNRFNLLKHLPVMSLLEFVKWREAMGNDQELINALDAMFLTLKDRIEITMVCEPDQDGKRILRYELSKRYDVELTFCNDNRNYKFQLFKIVQRGRTGNIKRPAIENALDRLTIGNLRQLFLDFHIDYILVSNFYYFNGDNNGQRRRAKVKSEKRDEEDGILSVICSVDSDYPIILKNIQLEHPS